MNKTIEKTQGWKTIVFGIMLVLLALLTNEEMLAFIGDYIPALMGSVGVIVIILRTLTKSPIFDKKEDK